MNFGENLLVGMGLGGKVELEIKIDGGRRLRAGAGD